MATMLRLNGNGDPCGQIHGVLPGPKMTLAPGYTLSWRDFFVEGRYRSDLPSLAIFFRKGATAKLQIGFFNGRHNELFVDIQAETAQAMRDSIVHVTEYIGGKVVHVDAQPKDDSFVRGVHNDLRRLLAWWLERAAALQGR